MTDFPDVKLKAQVNFPSTVAGGAGIDVAKTNGNFTISLAFDDFAPPVTDYDATFKCVLLWDSVSGNYTLAPYITGGGGGALPATVTPLVEGVGAIGVSLKYAREDHVHPAGGGGGSAPLPATAAPLVEGTATVGVSLKYAREDHIHPAGSAGGSLPGGGVNGYLLQTNGTVASWVGFLAAGAGAIIRTWQDKLRDFISVRDYGTDTAGFAAALAASSFVRVPAGSYTATVSVAYDQMLEFEGGAAISALTSLGTVIKRNYNPDGLTWTSWAGKHNKAGIQVDLGGFGDTIFGASTLNPIGLPIAIIGSVAIPSSSTNPAHGAALAGFTKTSSTTTFGVGVYGQGEIGAAGCAAWGGNVLTTDNGLDGNQLWGIEVDVNAGHTGTNVLGCDVIGGSTAEASGYSVGVSIQPYGIFHAPKPLKWTWGMALADGTAYTGISIGATEQGTASMGSMPLSFACFNSGGGRIIPAQLALGPNGTLNIDAANGVSVRNNPGFYYMVGNGNALSFFNSGRANSLQTVTGSKGGNAALASLISALHNIGLITDGSS